MLVAWGHRHDWLAWLEAFAGHGYCAVLDRGHFLSSSAILAATSETDATAVNLVDFESWISGSYLSLTSQVPGEAY